MSRAGAAVILLCGCAYDFDHFATFGSGGNSTTERGGAQEGGTRAASGAGGGGSSGRAGAPADGGDGDGTASAGGGADNGGAATSGAAAGALNGGFSSVGASSSHSGGSAGSSGKAGGGAATTGGAGEGGTTGGGGSNGSGGTMSGGGTPGFDCDELSGTAANQHCYFAVGRGAGLNWRAAKAACEAYSAHLVTITSSAEEQLVKSTFFPSVTDYWIGLALTETSGDTPPRTCKSAPSTCPFRWVTGEALSYTGWATRSANDSEPNYSGPCVRIQLSDLKWADYGCSMGQLPGICEFE